MKQNITTILKITFHFCLLTFDFLLLASCTPTEPQNNAAIIITAEDASCTEAWINLKLTSRIALPTAIKLFKNDSLVTSKTVNSKDTTLFVENLLPNQTYKFQTIIQSTNQKSNSINITTMDTTSHNFTWETLTFGGVNGSSYLKDVAIINENNIWAVGEIHTAETDQFDSNGVWVKPYNAVHWNGDTWELKRIWFYSDPDKPSYGKDSSPCEAIFVFNNNSYMISSNVQVAIFDKNGSYQITKMGFPWKDRFTISSTWGTSSKDFYVVGNGGNIAHYNGSSWEKIESGTELNIYDIWGDFNNKTSKWEILAVAKSNSEFRTAILQIKNNAIVSQPITDLGNVVFGTTWFSSNKIYYIGGMGIYKKHSLDREPWGHNRAIYDDFWHYVSKMRANNINDIIGVGGYGEVIHFNGVSWKSYYDKTKLNSGNYKSVDIKENLVIAVGFKTPFGAITIGKR